MEQPKDVPFQLIVCKIFILKLVKQEFSSVCWIRLGQSLIQKFKLPIP